MATGYNLLDGKDEEIFEGTRLLQRQTERRGIYKEKRERRVKNNAVDPDASTN